jgi:integrase
MAVVPRKRAGGKVVYTVVNTWPDKPGANKQQSELVGPSRREAEIRDRAMKREIAAGTYQPPGVRTKPTLGAEGKAFLDQRTNRYAADERRMWRLYVEPRTWLTGLSLDDVSPARHIDRLVAELRAEAKPDGSRRLSDKSIANVLGLLALIFKSAIRAERCLRNPIVLAPRTLRRAPVVEREIYQPGELVVLMNHHEIGWGIRTLNGLCGLGGFREGEACGLRWRDLDLSTTPLAALTVRGQYGGHATKTERPRVVPVHPVLLELLRAWADEGFELLMGRKSTPDDFIVPNHSARRSAEHHTRSSYYKAFVRSAEAAGVRPRSLHALRHTMISLARRGGARKDMLERVTHNALGDIVDRYTHIDWLPLCEAVLCIKLDAHPDPQRGPQNPGELGGGKPGALPPIRDNSPAEHASPLGSIPGASTRIQQKKSHSGEARQETRQVAEANPGELSRMNRLRKRRLLALAAFDPDAARPGLVVCRALDAAYAGDLERVGRLLTEEARRHG